MGAEVRTFLLEKSRVTSSSGAGERSYHIYYQVLAGANMAEMGDIGVPELKGKKAEGFHYTNQSGTVRSEAIDDDKEFKDMHHGLKSCGLSDEDRVSTYQVVSSVLSIGEVSFEPDGDGAAIAPATKAHLAKACELLGIEDVSVDLVEKVTKVGVEEFHIKLTMEAAAKQKDALAKHIFNLLFDLLVGNMNLKIDTDKHMHKFIGLLDVFGFEVFQSNSFEQLCINYANERLHNFFLMRVFEVEIELYRMQNLNVPKLDYPDNAKVIELLEKKPAGIFPCLDGQCKMPKATDLTFAASLHKSHKEQPHFSTLSKAHLKGVNLRDEETFVVRHFAADVCYTAAGFLEKNSDALSPEFEKKLTNSSKSLVKQLIQGVVPKAAAEGGVMLTSRGSKVPMSARRKSTKGGFDGGKDGKDGKDGKGGQPAQSSVGAKFLKGLSQLMREIATTHPYFVRCIKPNQVLKPLVFNSAMILRQLQCSGTIECVKLMQAGYPNRAPYADLHSRFQKALPDKMSNLEPKEFVEVLLAATGCQDGDYQMGQDMVFFKGSKGAVLQELMLTPKEELASKILEKLKVSDPKNAQIKVLEEYIELRKKQRTAAFSRLVNGVQGVCAMFDWIGAWELAKRKRNEAAAKMQAHARGKHARKQVHEMKESGKKIEIIEAPVVAEPDLEVVFDLNAELKKMEDEKAKEPEDEAAAEAAEHEAKWFVSADNCPHADMKGSSKKYHRFLMCKGVEWGFQYHNFYGDWEFDDEQPLCNGRPHYKHNTMYGGYAHLFHCIDPHYHVPRWVIGPSPGNENGWAFCESDAPTPWENTACWISWDGFEWHTCKNFRFVPKEHELDGLSDEDQFDEEAELEVYYAEQQKQQEEEEARAAAKAAAAKPESKPAESKPAVEVKQVKAEPEPKPEAKADKKKKGDKKKDEKKKEKKGGLFGKKK